MSFHVPEPFRVRTGRFASDLSDGNNGYFDIPSRIAGRALLVIASDGCGWEHVSAHAEQKGGSRLPVWEEMCQLKDLMWDEEDVVIQYHPSRSEYVSFHATTLHLWRPIGQELPTPPPILVGPLSAANGTASEDLGREHVRRTFIGTPDDVAQQIRGEGS